MGIIAKVSEVRKKEDECSDFYRSSKRNISLCDKPKEVKDAMLIALHDQAYNEFYQVRQDYLRLAETEGIDPREKSMLEEMAKNVAERMDSIKAEEATLDA